MSTKRSSPTADVSQSKKQKKSHNTPSTIARSSPKSSAPAKPVNTRVRFSASPPPAATERAAKTSTALPVAEAEDDEDDSDSAPEDITTSAAATAVKAADLKRAQAQGEEREAEKQRRREKDAKLKAQTKDRAKKQKRKPSSAPAATANPSGDIQSEQKAVEGDDDVPDLLPDEILQDPSLMNRPPTPSPEPESTPRRERLKAKSKVVKLDATEKRPKDVVRNGVTLSVLPKRSAVLPPKASKNGADVRKQWLDEGRTFSEKRRLGLLKGR